MVFWPESSMYTTWAVDEVESLSYGSNWLLFWDIHLIRIVSWMPISSNFLFIYCLYCFKCKSMARLFDYIRLDSLVQKDSVLFPTAALRCDAICKTFSSLDMRSFFSNLVTAFSQLPDWILLAGNKTIWC